jgi:Predicted flavoprotein
MTSSHDHPPARLEPVRIVAIGGSTRPGSTTEMALRCAAAAAESEGAEMTYVVGRDLLLPIYDVQTDERDPGAQLSSMPSAEPTASSSPARATTAASVAW